jgi:hypothetical protein
MSCYAVAATRKEVRQILGKSAQEILTFMRGSLLYANPNTSKFIMFGRAQEEPIMVGGVKIPQSSEEVLLGFTFCKSLT